MKIESRLVRYADLIPCRNAFVDARTPGSDAKENFSLIGPGVSENPNQHVHIPEPHGFNIGAARQPGGCLNSQHSHETAEVFVVHSGRWAITFGAEAGSDGEVEVAPGDVYSVPTQMFRGFRKLDEGSGFLWVVLGRDDPGRVQWAPRVFDLARQYGLVLLKGGRLVDTTVGETVPPGAEREEAPSEELVRRLATPSPEKLASCAARLADMRGNPRSPLAAPGVEECPVITPTDTRDGFAPGPITGWWPHGFNLRLLRMVSGATVPPHARDEEEVIFVHHGTLEVTVAGERVAMAAGDTFTTPKGAPRSFRALSSDGVLAYVVRGGDEAGAVRFTEQRAAAE